MWRPAITRKFSAVAVCLYLRRKKSESPSAFQRKICILTNSEGKNLTCLGKKSVHTDMAGLQYVDRTLDYDQLGYQWEEKCKLMEYKKL